MDQWFPADPTISVVIPAYNAGEFLRETLASVFAQTRPAREVLVVDDGSTDDTAEVARTFGPPLRLIRQPNRGVAAARNRALSEATGDLIAFLDADDVWKPEKLKRVIETAAAARTRGPVPALIYHGYYRFGLGKKGTSNRPIPRHRDLVELSAKLLVDWPCCPTSTVIRRDLADGLFFPEGVRHGEDVIFWSAVARRGGMLHLPEILSGYRKSPQQATRNVSGPIRAIEAKWRWAQSKQAAFEERELSYLVRQFSNELQKQIDRASADRNLNLIRQAVDLLQFIDPRVDTNQSAGPLGRSARRFTRHLQAFATRFKATG